MMMIHVCSKFGSLVSNCGEQDMDHGKQRKTGYESLEADENRIWIMGSRGEQDMDRYRFLFFPDRFLDRERIFFIFSLFFMLAFSVESVFSYFLFFLL